MTIQTLKWQKLRDQNDNEDSGKCSFVDLWFAGDIGGSYGEREREREREREISYLVL